VEHVFPSAAVWQSGQLVGASKTFEPCQEVASLNRGRGLGGEHRHRSGRLVSDCFDVMGPPNRKHTYRTAIAKNRLEERGNRSGLGGDVVRKRAALRGNRHEESLPGGESYGAPGRLETDSDASSRELLSGVSGHDEIARLVGLDDGGERSPGHVNSGLADQRARISRRREAARDLGDRHHDALALGQSLRLTAGLARLRPLLTHDCFDREAHERRDTQPHDSAAPLPRAVIGSEQGWGEEERQNRGERDHDMSTAEVHRDPDDG